MKCISQDRLGGYATVTNQLPLCSQRSLTHGAILGEP